jgi:two-component system OmpR family sensor kinase
MTDIADWQASQEIDGGDVKNERAGGAPEPPRRVKHSRQWPLRTRLTAGLLLLLVAACLALGVATTFALQHFLTSRLDDQLASAGNRYVQNLEHLSDNDADNKFSAIPGQSVGTLGVRTKAGQIVQVLVVGSVGNKNPMLTPADGATLLALPTDGQPRAVDLVSVGTYRVRAVSGRDGETLITGLPTDPVTDTVARLIIIEIVVFVAVLVVTGLAATVFIRYSLKPLRRIASTALQVSQLPLASGEVVLPDRVAASDPRTEVGQVGAAFNHMLGHVERSLATREATEERLRQFISNASHELRTPIASIQSNAELARRSRDLDPAIVDNSLRRVESESRRMARLVDDLLLLARLDSGDALMHEEVDLSRIVLDVVGDQQLAAPDHHWILNLPEEPVTIIGDGHRMQQIVANLAVNARTHTPAGTAVTTGLVWTVNALGDRCVVLTVSDNGPGIPEALQPLVFQRFVRGGQPSTGAEGSTGLGLAIVAAVVHAHGGEIQLTSHPGQTSIAITLEAVARQLPVAR